MLESGHIKDFPGTSQLDGSYFNPPKINYTERSDEMAQKDASQKILESYNDVFSDIVNVLLFKGRKVLSEEELEDQAPRSYYKADGKIHEIERDVAKKWKNGNIRVACIGFENQTASDPDMPLRVIGYDGAEYRAQLLNKQAVHYPVVTLVLYFGHKQRWSGPQTLKERLDIPKEFDKYVNDYKIHVFEIAFMDQKEVDLFQSDFRAVAEYFVQKRENGDYKPRPQDLKHVQETLQLLSVMTNDHRFEDVYNEASDAQKGEMRNMCEILDKIENRGIEKGRAEGKAEGIAEGIEKGIVKGNTEGKSQMADLMKRLLTENRIEDAKRAAEDPAYCDELMKQYGIG